MRPVPISANCQPMPDPSFVLPLLLQSVLVPAAVCAALLLLLALLLEILNLSV